MKVIDLNKVTLYVDDIKQIYHDTFYNIQTTYGNFQVDAEDYYKVRDYLLSLNDEVEVIKDKKIERIKDLNSDYCDIQKTYNFLGNEEIVLDILTLKNKINEIIDDIIKENK